MINRCSINVYITRRGTLKDDINNGDVPAFDSNSATTGRPMRVRRPPELYGMTDFYQSYVKSADYDRLLKPPVQLYPESHSEKNGSLIEKRLVIPRRFRPELIQLHNSSLFAGHVGAEKTYLRLQRKYYWVNMYKETHEHCLSCDVYQRDKLTKIQLPVMQHIEPIYLLWYAIQ